ncbi:hypothetical protein [Bradyrhizobium sp. OK095]|uniref:hypothetical protein n=1 Tax=Bradyrhizobium sp. OK095 TaxID=1882760 RepID=UPI0008CEC6CE|nr:hypothetical protein [Bradyrhizobium sp. OK095]SEN34153.1 hypothetical protein SAMN05443254_107375 [Bradyrhizobium sp. OK095]
MLNFSVLETSLNLVVDVPDFAVHDKPDLSQWKVEYETVARRRRLERSRGQLVTVRPRGKQFAKHVDFVGYATASVSSSEIKRIAGSVVMDSVAEALATKSDVRPSFKEVRRVAPAIHITSDFPVFRPSPELTAVWLQGVLDHLREMQISKEYRTRFEAFLNMSRQQVVDEFGVRLQRIMATIGNRQRYGIEGAWPLAKGGQFSLVFQHLVLDRLPIRPDDSSRFFSLLLTELMQWLESGQQIGGSWGRLRIDHELILLEISPRQSVTKIEGRARAKVLE